MTKLYFDCTCFIPTAKVPFTNFFSLKNYPILLSAILILCVRVLVEKQCISSENVLLFIGDFGFSAQISAKLQNWPLASEFQTTKFPLIEENNETRKQWFNLVTFWFTRLPKNTRKMTRLVFQFDVYLIIGINVLQSKVRPKPLYRSSYHWIKTHWGLPTPRSFHTPKMQ